MSIQFSGGEPTLSPHFLDAIRYARKNGFFAVQCATNGIRFAQEPGASRTKAKEAGLRMAYLQFDGVDNESNAHRKIGNLFDVKLRAIENLHAAGIDVILVVTVVNGVNNDQVGPIVEFAIENADKITVVSFQPVSFTGRDEDITDELRAQQRYTLSHLAHDIKKQTGITEPLRDWFPLSAMGPFSDLTDTILGETRRLGLDEVRLPPELRHRHGPLRQQEDEAGGARSPSSSTSSSCSHDIQDITDAAQGRAVTIAEVAVALLQNFDADKRARLSFPDADEAVPQPDGRARQEDRRARERRARVRVARPLRRRHVVPGSLQLRLPPHRDVHHPVRHADG